MIYGVIGENSFAREQRVSQIVGERAAERYDGVEIEPLDLSDVLAAQTLFAADRVVVLRDASLNKALWGILVDRLETIDESLTLVIVETKLDKRTKAYKQLQKHAQLTTCDYWSDRQTAQAEAWLRDYATKHGLTLEQSVIGDLVRRATRPSDTGDKPVIDQQLLASAVEQLALVDAAIDSELIATVMPAVTHDNVFGLLAAAMRGDTERLEQMLSRLRHDQEAHRLLALLASQATNLAALVLSGGRSADSVAADIGASPYAVSQLTTLAGESTRADITMVIDALKTADMRAKTGADAWGALETALLQVVIHAQQNRPAS